MKLQNVVTNSTLRFLGNDVVRYDNIVFDIFVPVSTHFEWNVNASEN